MEPETELGDSFIVVTIDVRTRMTPAKGWRGSFQKPGYFRHQSLIYQPFSQVSKDDIRISNPSHED